MTTTPATTDATDIIGTTAEPPRNTNVLSRVTKTLWGGVTWTTFEKVWLAVFTTVNAGIYLYNPDTLLGLVATMSGMLCVVLAAKAHIGTYIFGIVQAIIYGWMSYQFAVYGEAMLNLLFYVPMQFIGFWMWKRNTVNQENTKTAAKRMNKKNIALLAVGTAVVTWLYALLLSNIGGASVGLDSITTILSVVAQFLMVARFREQWTLWIIINILSIALWINVGLTQGEMVLPMIAMWSAFLVNSIYGYVNWTKMSKQNDMEENNEEVQPSAGVATITETTGSEVTA